MKGYLSVKEVARKWNISVRWVNQYIQGRTRSRGGTIRKILGDSGGRCEARKIEARGEKKSSGKRLIM